jgi:hypothetical protein
VRLEAQLVDALMRSRDQGSKTRAHDQQHLQVMDHRQTKQPDRGAKSIIGLRTRQLDHPVVESIDERRFDYLAQTKRGGVSIGCSRT